MSEANSGLGRMLVMEVGRVTEAAAITCARLRGRGDVKAADQAATDAMRKELARINIRGKVVIGEGEKDEAPMLFNGEVVGNGREPRMDVAVDDLDRRRSGAAFCARK